MAVVRLRPPPRELAGGEREVAVPGRTWSRVARELAPVLSVRAG